MFKNIFKILSSHIVVKSLGLVNIAIVLFFLSVEDFGNYSYSLLLLNLIAVIVDPFLSSYLVDYKTFNYKKFNFGILILSIILSPAFYFIISYLNKDLNLITYMLFTATFLVGTSLKSYLNVKERYYSYGIVDIIRQLGIFFTTIIFFYILDSNNYIELLEFNYLVTFLAMISIAIVFLKKEEIEFNINFTRLKNQTIQSKFLIFYTALVPFISFIDSYFVDAYLTEEDLGIYSFSLKIYNISLMLVVPIFTVLNIKQIEIAKENNYLTFISKNFKKVILFSVVIFLGTFLFNWIITNYIYLEYKSSFWNTNILMFGSFITYITLPFSFLIAYRKYKYLFTLGVLAILFNIIINYFFIEKYGMMIAAFSTLLSQLIINFGAAFLSYILLRNNKNEN
ncbi:oligosaccharide flippase family protein [Polaribacter sp. Z014]|uniref:oligosaccharide flippase family protein n=1 Tax=Polaribacter sp. Z014 TaxID=2927126 RepID=UPI00202049ED|nr:oligosaccharide flippase family protein [Polaribacter sp. Z014]MCL7761851.1 oligosaccharide flippase family protein [Polaribacter sp. Z014]